MRNLCSDLRIWCQTSLEQQPVLAVGQHCGSRMVRLDGCLRTPRSANPRDSDYGDLGRSLDALGTRAASLEQDSAAGTDGILRVEEIPSGISQNARHWTFNRGYSRMAARAGCNQSGIDQ